jgi:glutaredoxin
MSPVVTLYTREGCHLCEEARQVLEAARHRARFSLELIDIDQDDALRKAYNEEVPVVAINGRKSFKYRVDEKEFLRRLAART